MKRPAFQFYPADWRKDMALQSCSVAARGLWMDMLCIAHECEPYGHLTVNGKPMTPAQIGRHTGLTKRECSRLVAELEDAGVLSRGDDGAIFSRRMVRDEDLRQRRADGGKAGSEHGVKGAEHGKKGGRPPKRRGVSEPPLEPPPSSSSSSSTTEYPPASLFPPQTGSRTRALRRCPGDFDAEPLRAWAATEAPRADFDREAAKFRDHTFRTAHSDWSAALRNWLRRADEDAAKRPQSAQDRREAEAAKWLRPSAVQRDFIDMEAPSNAAPLALR